MAIRQRVAVVSRSSGARTTHACLHMKTIAPARCSPRTACTYPMEHPQGGVIQHTTASVRTFGVQTAEGVVTRGGARKQGDDGCKRLLLEDSHRGRGVAQQRGGEKVAIWKVARGAAAAEYLRTEADCIIHVLLQRRSRV